MVWLQHHLSSTPTRRESAPRGSAPLRAALSDLLRGGSDDASATAAPVQLVLQRGELWGHVLSAFHAMYCADAESESAADGGGGGGASWRAVTLVDVGESDSSDFGVSDARGVPALVSGAGELLSDDPVEIAAALVPDLVAADDAGALARVEALADATWALGHERDQGRYEDGLDALGVLLEAEDARVRGQRFLRGAEATEPALSDMLLFAWLVRLDAVWFELFKVARWLLRDWEGLNLFARDLAEVPALWGALDIDQAKRFYYLQEPELNNKLRVPGGGLPRDLHQPHFREIRLAPPSQQHTGSGSGSGGGGGARAGGVADTAATAGRHAAKGEWVRPPSNFQNWITPAGVNKGEGEGKGEGEDDEPMYPAEAGRYHIYAPMNCPWSHRVILARAVKGLQDVVGLTMCHPRRHPEKGWQINADFPGNTPDPVKHSFGSLGDGRIQYVRELYEHVGSPEKSVPVLWDTKTETIVSNESAVILRMFDSAFGDLAKGPTLVPKEFEATIDLINSAIYSRVNNGSYKAGFTDSQEAYDLAFARYFACLDWVEAQLKEHRWLAGTPEVSEADLRLFPTVARHDQVYFSRFKLNKARIADDYPRIADWLERMYAIPGIREGTLIEHVVIGYFGRTGNQIVPAGIPLGKYSPRNFSRAIYSPGDP